MLSKYMSLTETALRGAADPRFGTVTPLPLNTRREGVAEADLSAVREIVNLPLMSPFSYGSSLRWTDWWRRRTLSIPRN